MIPPAPGINPHTWRLAQLFLRSVFEVYIRTVVTGREGVPPPGVPTIVAGNHVSDLDVLAAGYAVKRSGYFIAKAEATRVPVIGPFLTSVGAIPAERAGRDVSVLKRCRAALAAGCLVGLAPEGTRSPDGRLGRYDSGFVWLAAKTGAVIVPAAIHGTWQLMPKGARFPRPGRIWIRFGAPLSATDVTGREGRDALASDVRARTLAMLRDLARESGVPSPAQEREATP